MPDASPLAEPIEPSFPKRVLITVALSIVVIGGVLLLWYAVQVLLIVFAGILVAILLRGMANILARHTRLSDSWALSAVVVLLILGFATIGYFVAPRIAVQAEQLYQTLPHAYEQAKNWIGQYPAGRVVLKTIATPPAQSSGHGDLLGNVAGAASTTLSVTLTFVLILFVGLYLASEPDLYINGLTRLFPKENREHVCYVLRAVGTSLAGWLVGQGIDMAFVGVLTALGLWLIGVPLAFTLGLLTAITNFIPNFGAFIAFVPSALLALTVSPHKVVMVGILFICVQGFEGYVMQPIIQRRTVALPPALTILAQVLLGLLLGPMGVLLATPLMAAAVVLVKVLYVRDVLHDPVPVKNAPPMANR